VGREIRFFSPTHQAARESPTSVMYFVGHGRSVRLGRLEQPRVDQSGVDPGRSVPRPPPRRVVDRADIDASKQSRLAPLVVTPHLG
jgi:hypothetical protein